MAGSEAQVADVGEKLMAAAGGKSDVGLEFCQQGVASPLPELQHPRSIALRRVLPNPERHYRLLAQVADTNFTELGEDTAPESSGTGHAAPVQASFVCSLEAEVSALVHGEAGPSSECEGESEPVGEEKGGSLRRAATMCALAKLHIELDRNEAAREWGYAVGIFRLLHAERMAKGDLIVGLPSECDVWRSLHGLLQLPSLDDGANDSI